MIAVESILNGLGDRACLKIFRKHRAPRNVLQSQPMTTVYGQHGNERHHMAKPFEHADVLNDSYADASNINCCLKLIGSVS